MKKDVVLANGGVGDEPPDGKAIRNKGVQWWNPQDVLEEEAHDFHHQNDYHQAQHLQKAPWPL